MPRKLLARANVITILKQMRRERMAGAQGFTEAIQEFRFGMAPGARSGHRPIGSEAAGMESTSSMGIPPLLATNANYHLFLKDVKFFENL